MENEENLIERMRLLVSEFDNKEPVTKSQTPIQLVEKAHTDRVSINAKYCGNCATGHFAEVGTQKVYIPNCNTFKKVLRDGEDVSIFIEKYTSNSSNSWDVVGSFTKPLTSNERLSIIRSVKVGDVVEVDVLNPTDLGVFINYRGVKSLLHATDLKFHNKIPSDFAKGELVNVLIKGVKESAERLMVDLPLKAAKPMISLKDVVTRSAEEVAPLTDIVPPVGSTCSKGYRVISQKNHVLSIEAYEHYIKNPDSKVTIVSRQFGLGGEVLGQFMKHNQIGKYSNEPVMETAYVKTPAIKSVVSYYSMPSFKEGLKIPSAPIQLIQPKILRMLSKSMKIEMANKDYDMNKELRMNVTIKTVAERYGLDYTEIKRYRESNKFK